MDAYRVWLSSQFNMDKGYQGRQFHRMTDAQRTQRRQILPRDYIHPEREYEPDQETCHINQTKGDTVIENRQSGTTREESVQHLHQRICSAQHSFL